MTATSMLTAQDVEDSLSGFNHDGDVRNLHKFLVNKLNLKYIGEGINRVVYKEKGSRAVFKICPFSSDRPHNIAEYVLYQGLKGHPLSKILCPTLEISRWGKVTKQTYMSRRVPYDSYSTLQPLEGLVLESFEFLRKLPNGSKKTMILDMHPDNLRMTSDYDIKLIDYSPLLFINALGNNFNRVGTIDKLQRMRLKGDPVVLYLDSRGGVAGRNERKVVTMYQGFSHEEMV